MTMMRETPLRGERYGVLAAPKIDALPVAEILADIEAREVVSLPELGKAIGMGQQSRKYAIRTGLITPVGGRLAVENRRQGHTITRDEACTLLLAAALAVAAGVATAIMLRGLKGTGIDGAAAAVLLRGMI